MITDKHLARLRALFGGGSTVEQERARHNAAVDEKNAAKRARQAARKANRRNQR